MKPCKPNQIRNPETNRCVLKTGKIGRELLGKKKSLSPKPCKSGQIRNPKTNRCVSKTGKIGRELLGMSEEEVIIVVPKKDGEDEIIIVNPGKKSPSSKIKKILTEEFDILNNEWLDGEYKLIWGDRKCALGVCKFGKKEIHISKHFFGSPIEIMKDTLRHEIAHALAWKYDKNMSHDTVWKKWAVKLGANPKSCTKAGVPDTSKASYALRHKDTKEVYQYFYKKPAQRRFATVKYTHIRGKKAHTFGKLEIVKL